MVKSNQAHACQVSATKQQSDKKILSFGKKQKDQ